MFQINIQPSSPYKFPAGFFDVFLNGKLVGMATSWKDADMFAYWLERQEQGNPMRPYDRQQMEREIANEREG